MSNIYLQQESDSKLIKIVQFDHSGNISFALRFEIRPSGSHYDFYDSVVQ